MASITAWMPAPTAEATLSAQELLAPSQIMPAMLPTMLRTVISISFSPPPRSMAMPQAAAVPATMAPQ